MGRDYRASSYKKKSKARIKSGKSKHSYHSSYTKAHSSKSSSSKSRGGGGGSSGGSSSGSSSSGSSSKPPQEVVTQVIKSQEQTHTNPAIAANKKAWEESGKPMPEALKETKTIAVTRSTEEGGTVTVTTKGKVTTRGRTGKITERYQADKEESEKFVKEESHKIRLHASEQRKIREQKEKFPTRSERIAKIFTKQGRDVKIDEKGNVVAIKGGRKVIVEPETGRYVDVPETATVAHTAFGLPERLREKKERKKRKLNERLLSKGITQQVGESTPKKSISSAEKGQGYISQGAEASHNIVISYGTRHKQDLEYNPEGKMSQKIKRAAAHCYEFFKGQKEKAGVQFLTAKDRGPGEMSPLKVISMGRGAGAAVGEQLSLLVYNPGERVTTIIAGGFNIVAHLGQSVKSIGKEFLKNPGAVAGELFFYKKGFEGVRQIKSTYIETGSKFIPPEKVFAESVLKGKETLPTSKSTAESLERFEAAKGEVTTATPSKLAGKEATIGKKASTGFEDPGIYVTPKGEGSPYFLRTTPMTPESSASFSLNPFKGTTQVPSVYEFTTKGVELQPRAIVVKPGYEAVSEFLTEQGKKQSGKVYITKRSEVGKGTVKDPSVRGTSEIEAVIPPGQKFITTPETAVGKIKGFDHYTEFKGEPVAVRKAKLVSEEPSIHIDKSRIVSGKNVMHAQESLSSIAKGSKVITPSTVLEITSAIGSIPKSPISYPLPKDFVEVKPPVVEQPIKPSRIPQQSYPKSSPLSAVSSYPQAAASSKISSPRKSSSSKGSSSQPRYPSKPVPDPSYPTPPPSKPVPDPSYPTPPPSKPVPDPSYPTPPPSKPSQPSYPSRPSPPTMPFMQAPPFRGHKKKVKKVSRVLRLSPKQPKSYTPTGFSAAFHIKGKPSVAGVKSGLGHRPIQLPEAEIDERFWNRMRLSS